ncbi:Geranylgeranyl pyrophosphate synthase [Eufriesea mexicana]|uniref:Geranylgeranyl pyrophosphate synthase n=1 Tax=Eufriesea mexicana TaxID=516756 RepID=A0A310SLK9_9HYME|nr:PREDICTED: geranylgeranyl pyrophosphate synthase [Eufriesea mexicana]OAD55868.1 Geranylgeranyl pyrophosphate synthase [Eufriesea mexicana]
MEQDKNIPYSQTGDKEEDKILLEPFSYILRVPGKQIRAKLAHAFNYWLKIPQDKFRNVGDIIQLLHTSSLLIDDIQDNSVLRRGIPVAHNIYGTANTINAANYVLFIALEKVLALNHPEATQVYVEQLLELHRGQGMEIYWRDNYICPSETAYKQMTIRKTGGLFNLAVRLMQLFSECKEDYTPLAGILGLYFQIRDDYCNLILQEYAENKSYCEDLSEGKFSFPIIHAVQSHSEDRQIMKDIDILRQRTKDIEVKRYCVNLLEKFGSFAYTRNVLEELDKKARDEVHRLGGNPILVEILDELMCWKHQDAQQQNKKGVI